MAFLVDEYLIEKILENGCTLLINGVEVGEGFEVNDGDVFTIKASPTRKIVEVLIRSNEGWGKHYELDIVGSGGGNSATAVVDGWIEPSIASLEVETVTPEVTGTNNLYLVDADIIKRVNQARFSWVGESLNPTQLDYGVYIISLYKLPFKIKSEYILDSGAIKLGNKSTGVIAETLSVDRLSIDLGEIKTPISNTPSMDLMRTSCNLMLPFANSIAVKNEYVIGQTLGVEYLIDLYSGDATVNLTSSLVGGEVFHSSKIELAVNIPYAKTNLDNVNASNMNISLEMDNHVRQATIELSRYEIILPYGFFSIPVMDDGLIGDFSGYVEVENVDLRVNALSLEKEQILNVLRNGVIIK